MTPRTKKLLGALGVAVALALWVKLGGSKPVTRPPARTAAGAAEDGVERPVATSARRGRAARRGQQELVTTVADLDVARLEAGRGAYATGRDLFSFYVPPPPPPPKPRGPTPEEIAAARRAAEEAARRQAEALAAAGPPKPVPPAINVTYIGSFGPANRRVAVFSNGETLYNALVGDVIEGKFRLVSIGFESVELAYVDFPDLPARQLPVGQEGV
ncbi:MAG TPA: hypothetical protein VF017_02470 [Thermoanaerobaculia bacterium]|nr:hypothetical protein [Thermoanaerobaculia bacterium]